jgi:cardiolipin synthase
VGSLFWLDAIAKRCDKEDIEFRVYHPVPGILQWLTPKFFTRTNRRNHRKTLIIDNETALVGSFNITQVHFEKIMGDKAWRDSGVHVTGEAVESLTAAFELAWNYSKNIPPMPPDSRLVKERIQIVTRWQHAVRLNVNERIRRQLYKDLCRRILHAQQTVYITTAYFLPKRALLKALAKAAQKGLDVRILIPGPSDIPFVKWAAAQIPYKLHQAGVQIFEYQPRILHAKYMIIDDWCSIGSLNMNHRSLLHDLEVEAVLTDANSLSNLRHQFSLDLSQSQPLSVSLYEQSPWWARWTAKILFKLRYWL